MHAVPGGPQLPLPSQSMQQTSLARQLIFPQGRLLLAVSVRSAPSGGGKQPVPGHTMPGAPQVPLPLQSMQQT